jgi:hypothetical protein
MSWYRAVDGGEVSGWRAANTTRPAAQDRNPFGCPGKENGEHPPIMLGALAGRFMGDYGCSAGTALDVPTGAINFKVFVAVTAAAAAAGAAVCGVGAGAGITD